MKKICAIAIISLLSVACKSNEEKALSLIDRAMFESLYDYASYEPVSTIIEEGISSIYTDSLIRNYAIKAEVTKNLYNEAHKNASNALEYAEIYADSYYSTGRRKFNEYMEEAKSEHAKAMIYIGLWGKFEDSIRVMASQFEPTHIGWAVKHKFRCKTKGGSFALGDYLYMMDDKFTKITSRYDMDEDDEKNIRERIDLALSESED